MGRAERRRAQKSEVKAKTATYNLTRAQLDALVRERINYELKKAREDAIADATILMLTLPLEVLMDYYWTKSYYKRIPEFTGHVLEYFEKMAERRIGYGCFEKRPLGIWWGQI